MTTTDPHRPIVVADSRGRVSLIKHGGITPGQMFVIDVGPGGVILLTPATAVPIGSLAMEPGPTA